MRSRSSEPNTVCPKVALKTKVPLFWTPHGWIPKPFGLLVAHIGGFDMAYKLALLTPKIPDMYWVIFRPFFEVWATTALVMREIMTEGYVIMFVSPFCLFHIGLISHCCIAYCLVSTSEGFNITF